MAPCCSAALQDCITPVELRWAASRAEQMGRKCTQTGSLARLRPKPPPVRTTHRYELNTFSHASRPLQQHLRPEQWVLRDAHKAVCHRLRADALCRTSCVLWLQREGRWDEFKLWGLGYKQVRAPIQPAGLRLQATGKLQRNQSLGLRSLQTQSQAHRQHSMLRATCTTAQRTRPSSQLPWYP